MNDKRPNYITWVLLVVLCYAPGLFANITMEVEPRQVQQGDTFRVVLTLDDTSFSETPDFTPLQDDFTIVSTQQRVAYSNVNGQSQSTRQWIILLIPNKAGKLVIPSLKVGGQKTHAISLDVLNDGNSTGASDPRAATQDSVIIKTSSSVTSPYVNQQVLYTVKIYTNKQLFNVEYVPPQVNDGLLFNIGDMQEHREELDGGIYSVLEQQYAVFPQKSGSFTITPPSFHAVAVDAYSQRVNAHGKQAHLSVKPIPSSATGQHWLPAEDVELIEAYDGVKPSMQAGDTFTRTVTIKSIAMLAQLLPKLTFNHESNLNAYAETPELSNDIQQQALVGRSTVKVTYVLTKSGDVSIPALRLPWFNTKTGKKEVARLPEKTIRILASGATKDDAPITQEIRRVEPTSAPGELSQKHPPYSIGWVIAAVFGTAWIITLVFWFLTRQGFQFKSQEMRAIKRLREACLSNRPRQTKAALMGWAQIKWPDATLVNLTDVAKCSGNMQFKKELQQLSNVLYDPNMIASWQGRTLWKTIEALRKRKRSNPFKRYDLPPINP